MSTENFYKQDNSNFVFLWMNSYSVTIQMKAAEQYLHVVLSTIQSKVALIFETSNDILKYDNEMKV